MLTYSNTNCLGNALTYISPTKFNAKAINNNCATFDGSNDYAYINSTFLGASKATFKAKLASDNANPKVVISNIFGANSAIGFTGQKFGLVLNGTQYLGDFIYDLQWHNYSVDVSGASPIIKIDGVEITASISTTGFVYKNTAIGARQLGSESNYGAYFNGQVCDLKAFDDYGELLYWWPLAEGADLVCYDCIGANNGNINTTSATNFWANKQDLFAYNIVNGFGYISGSTAKVPLAISGITYTEEHPSLSYGHNLAESKLDFTQGVSGIAEFNALSGVNNYVAQTSVGGLYKHSTTSGEQNYLLYKKAQTGVNLSRVTTKLLH